METLKGKRGALIQGHHPESRAGPDPVVRSIISALRILRREIARSSRLGLDTLTPFPQKNEDEVR